VRVWFSDVMPSERVRPDACPGVLALHEAADGLLARIRLPGGMVNPEQLRTLADCAEQFGDGFMHLTSRGNLQLRGLDRDDPLPAERLGQRLSAAGLLPSPAHERVRNFLASPLPGLADARRLVLDLDRAVCARPDLAALPGRFLLALDSGRGDVATEGADVCWRAVSADSGALLLDGDDTGLRVPLARAVDALVLAAATFAEARGQAWRVRESPTARHRIHDVLAAEFPRVPPVRFPRAGPVPVGPIPSPSGPLVGAAVPLGTLTAAQLRLLAGARSVAITPWRTCVVGGIEPQRLTAAGLVVDPAAPGLGVSACAGRPGCARSAADVRADARELLSRLPADTRVHLAGCERRCGRPGAEHVDVVAQDGGYGVDGAWVPAERLLRSLTHQDDSGQSDEGEG
jgi:precorrin-3B synthase